MLERKSPIPGVTRPHKGLYNGVGGKWEDNESIVQAMVREFKEEAGVTTTRNDWQVFAVMSGSRWRCYCYTSLLDDDRFYSAHTCTDEPVVLLDVDYAVSSVYDVCVPNVRWLLPLAKDKLLDTTLVSVDIQYK